MKWYMGRKGSGESAQSLDSRKEGLEGEAEKDGEWETQMVIKNQLGVMKDNRGEKGKLMDVDGGAELDFFSFNPLFFCLNIP